MDGHIITYKPKDAGARTSFHQCVFGRLVYRNYRGRKYAYYAPGILDNIRFARVLAGKVFVETLDGIDIDLLNIGCEIDIHEEERDESHMALMTGREYWSAIAKEKGLMMRTKRSSRK